MITQHDSDMNQHHSVVKSTQESYLSKNKEIVLNITLPACFNKHEDHLLRQNIKV